MTVTKLSLVLGMLAFSGSAMAISNDDLAKACLEKGKSKIAAQAVTWNCPVDLNQVEVQEIDNRWYNPSKYVWYQVRGECNGADRIIQLVQYYRGRCI